MSLNNPEEEVIRFQQGDIAALEEIYQYYKQPLYRFIYRFTANKQLSIDVVQDTFEKLQRKKHQYDPAKGKFKTYLYQIAYNTMMTKLKRERRFETFFPFLVQKQPPPSISQEDKLTVQKAVQKLPEDLRAVIVLTYYHDLPQKEIADIMGIPAGTVKSRLFRALRKLKKDLGVDEA
jgi:RNA polymerase sigma-70 factor, ECF subfamily